MPTSALWASLPEELAITIASKAFESWTNDASGWQRMVRNARHMAQINRTFLCAFLPLHLMLRYEVEDPRHALSLVEGIVLYLHRRPELPRAIMYSFMHTLVYKSCTYKALQPNGRRENGCPCGDSPFQKYVEVCVQRQFLDATTLGLILLYTNGVFPRPSKEVQQLAIRVLSSLFNYVKRYHLKNVGQSSLRAHVTQAYVVVNAVCA